ncbi:Fibroblast growth factor receptor 4, partial [Lamellibrachia satsuma]
MAEPQPPSLLRFIIDVVADADTFWCISDPNNADDKALMVAKMKFWVDSKLKHENILHFVGAVPEGPILLFELCILGRLKNWLAAQRKVTEDVEDKMITFSVHIARGMQYLHSRQILHRRLGTRNILLTRAGNDAIAAKISGFGPMKGDLEDSEVDPMDEKVPVKWMAPEQLDLPPDVARPYDTKTDIWSFGVTMWEMFSKGDIPYDGITSGELKARLDSGYRMERPDHCPELMYEQVVQPCWNGSATARPTFDDVSKNIEGLFIGGATDDDEYYYDRRTDEAPWPSYCKVRLSVDVTA